MLNFALWPWRSLKILAIAVLVILCAVTAVWRFAQPPAEPLEKAEEALRRAAIAQITAESQDATRSPQVSQPEFAASSERARRPVAGGALPPSGYSITAYHGEMTKAPRDIDDYERERDVTQEHPWLVAPDALDALIRHPAATERDWVYGWVGIASGVDGVLLGERLKVLGAQVVGTSGNLLRVRLPRDGARLVRIARLPGVAGVAPTPAAMKMPPLFAEEAASGAALPRVPVLVTLMDDDPRGVWRQALEDLGGVVGTFDAAVSVYPAVFDYAALDAVVAADFVLAVEPVRRVEAANDSAVPAMGADALRLYDGASTITGIGGATVPIGVMDTGLNVNHEAIGVGRRSICGGNFATDLFLPPRKADLDLWIDEGLHGTHVTGTLVGNGAGAPRFAGMAPLVQDIRFAKVLTAMGVGSSITVSRGMDFLSRPTACGGNEAPAVKAALVNMSLADDGVEWSGQSADERKLDSIVWMHRQLYVVAQSNAGFRQYSNFASAKNSLAVGAIEDGSDLASFSSLGPTADGRLKPQLVATGVDVYSAVGLGRRTGYRAASGTSMAAPSAAGVAALLMDAVPELRGQPAAVRARLMASAIRPDAFLEDVVRFPLNNTTGPGALQHRYGLGKVSARTSALNRDTPDGWISGAAVVEMGDAGYAYRDILVPPGASRLDIVMTWDERAADTLSGTLLNDLDLWVDRGADCPESRAACGEAASRSAVDNVEWVILRNPPAGVYRLKIVPKHVRVDAPRAAVAWTLIRGSSTPRLAVTVDPRTVRAAPDESFTVAAEITADNYVAAGVTLRVDCRGAPESTVCERVEFVAANASKASREDSVTRVLQGESGDAIALGELAVGEEQTVELVFHGVPTSEMFWLHLTATAWNAHSASTPVAVVIGEPAPAMAAGPVAQVPANDGFTHAQLLNGAAGRTEFDLLLATPEPGEPPFEQRLVNELEEFHSTERPRSLWYRFRAPANDTYRFTIAKAAADDVADDIQLDLFEPGDLHSVSPLVHAGAKSGGGLTFIANRNRNYVIRLGIIRERLFDYEVEFDDSAIQIGEPTLVPTRRRSLRPLSLHWQLASRPANDDFELAEALTGSDGEVRRNNQGATEQAGERLQPMAATVWYRWKAPPGSDGDWRFSVDRRYLLVAAFTGDQVGNLRLVSGFPSGTAAFPVVAGQEYRIVVATGAASLSGTEYTLAWEPGARPDDGFGQNDDIERAEPLSSESQGSYLASANLTDATVEPDEPLESGVRTLWWSWTAPDTGRSTWRIGSLDGDAIQLAVFAAGDPLTPLAASAPDRTHVELSFDATENQRYLFSAGLPIDQALLPLGGGLISFEWGATPSNDNFAVAEGLTGQAGSVVGDSRFATVEPGEDTAQLGDASLWWTWEAPADGWYRFEIEEDAGGIVAVYRTGADGALTDEPARVGRLLPRPALVFHARGGARYAIRVGIDGRARPGSFTLTWSENGPPAWLRYAGALRHGYLDGEGSLTNLVSPGSIAFNTDGGRFYVTTAVGLQVYERDAESGKLAYRQTDASAAVGAQLFWDARSASLIAASCSDWRRYGQSEAGDGLANGLRITGAAPCPEDTLLRGPDGSVLYLAGPLGVTRLQWNEDHSGLSESGQISLPGITGAAIRPAGDYLYVKTADGLQVLAWNAESESLEVVSAVGDDGYGFVSPDEGSDLLTVDPSGRYLLTVSASREMDAFDLEAPENPRQLVQGHYIDEFLFGGGTPCAFADMRSDTPTVDVFCEDTAYSVRLLTDDPRLRMEDRLRAGEMDAFGNNLPLFSLTRGLAVSPDGRHIYAAGLDTIMIFERTGSH